MLFRSELRSGIQNTVGDANRQVRINVVEVERVDADAFLLAEYIAQQLEKRVAFRRVLRMTIQRAQRAGVLGLKIQVSGRLNGAEIARTDLACHGEAGDAEPELRRELGMEQEEDLVATSEDGRLVLQRRASVVEQLRGMFRDRKLDVDGFIAEKRAEAAREEERGLVVPGLAA